MSRGAEPNLSLATRDTIFHGSLIQSCGGFCNHSTRGHIRSDLHRYAFAAAFAQLNGRSPELADFPERVIAQSSERRECVIWAAFF